MTPFQDTVHCRSGRHCRTCRDREGGRAWRRGLAAFFQMPASLADSPPDFDCPQGLPWGFLPPPRDDTGPRREPVIIPPGAEAICAACPDARACANVPCVTCGGQMEVHIVIPCPRGRW